MPYIYIFSQNVYTACWANLILELWAMPIVQPKYRLQSDGGVLQPRSELLYIPPPISSAAPHFFTTPYAQKLAIKCTTNGIRNAFFEICFIFHKEAVVVNKSLLAWKLNFKFLVELHSRSHLFFPWHALSKSELEG